MPQQLLKKIQLAELGGTSRAYITQECRPGGSMHGAVVGQRVDITHPSVAEWLQNRDTAPTSLAKTSKKSSRKTTKKAPKRVIPVAPAESPGIKDNGSSEDAATWAKLTIHDACRLFGGEPQLHNWLKNLNLIETVRERRLKNEQSEGSLISRDLVETHLLGLYEEAFQRLLTDLPKTLARTIRAHAQSGTPLEQSEREIRNALGKTLDATKQKVTRKLSKI